MSNKKTGEVLENTVALPQNRVTIKFYPRATAMVTDPKHMLYGGLAPNTGKTFQLPRNRTGAFVNPFPSEEIQNLLERKLGLPENGLSPLRMENNFFDKYVVTLNKSDMILELKDPIMYIQFLVAKTQRDHVAPSFAKVKDKATFMWYVEDENEAVERRSLKISKKSEAWKEFGKIENSKSKLRQILIEHKGKSVLPDAANNIDWLQGQVGELIEHDPEVFVNYAKDPNLPVKVDIYDAILHGILKRAGSGLLFQEDDTPLALENDVNDIGGAIRYLRHPENSEYYATVKQRIQNAG
jgi:hypothetical protein